jgi:hypothetical protein
MTADANPRVLWESERRDHRIVVSTQTGDLHVERLDHGTFVRVTSHGTAERYLGTLAGLLLLELDAALANIQGSETKRLETRRSWHRWL